MHNELITILGVTVTGWKIVGYLGVFMFTSRCAPGQYFTLAAILAISAPTSLLAADDDVGPESVSLELLCELSGGFFPCQPKGGKNRHC